MLEKIHAQAEISQYFALILTAPNIDVALHIARRFRYAQSEVTYWDCSIEEAHAVIKRCSFAPLYISDKEHCLYAIALVYLLLKSVA